MDGNAISLVVVLMSILRWDVCASLSPEEATLVHSAILDPTEKFHVFWTFDEKQIVFEVHVETLGYVGFGLSPNGDMKGSDIVIGGVNNEDDKIYFTDRHATGKQEPLVDDHQDWYLVRGSQNDTHTILRFWRPLETCDDNDRPIQSETARVIWAFGDDDAEPTGKVHNHKQNRGSKSIFLLNPQKALPEIPTDSLIVDFLHDKVAVPDSDTTYWCEAFAIPVVDRKHHVIKFEPVVQPGHEALVHHFVLYGCYQNVSQETVGQSMSCFEDFMPEAWRGCSTTIFAWAVGGGSFYFPEHVGFPFGFEEDPNLLILQTHYDNPGRKRNFVDSSGLRLTLSPTPRKYDAAAFSTGAIVSRNLIIPPFAEHFRTDGHCVPECLTQAMEGHPSSIQMFAGFLHAHLLGTAIRLRHFRDGVEQKVVIEDKNYDFNFQETRTLEKEVIIKSGDHLVTECDYKSTERTNVTFGGESTRHEMCLTFVLYYPRIPLSSCISWATPDTLANFLNATFFPNMTVSEPEQYKGLHHSKVFEGHVDWTDKSVRKRFQEVTTSYERPVQVACYTDMRTNYPINGQITKLPKITKTLEEGECVRSVDDDVDDVDAASILDLNPLLLTLLSGIIAVFSI